MNGDGVPDLVVTPDEGGGPRVLIYDGAGFAARANFFGIDDESFRGGARAAVGDVNGDGRADLIVAAGFGGGPRIAGFNGLTVMTGRAPEKLFNDFFVFEQSLRNGAFVTVGDLDGDGFADLIAGGGPGGGPRVLALSGADLAAGRVDAPKVLFNDFLGDPADRGGVRVAVKDLDGDTQADLIAGDGSGAGNRVVAYRGQALLSGSLKSSFELDPFGDFRGGVFVG
ncbi:FG-GAP repeat domain-containing protein [Limnoglobus roseus]|uniref:FG-GAP repeat domain-containing protein n=1 Tax=Limnoglobus roseus TaxID=2598579 RepID=UPI0011EB1A02|nr:VCBS repeat-containing protein [Limnoglobus roseus]